MARPTKKDSEKKQKVLVTLDKSIYKNLKQKNLKISTYINQLLKIALLNDGKQVFEENVSNRAYAKPARALYIFMI